MEALVILLRLALLAICTAPAFTMRSDERIRKDGYPVEQHVVQTADGYVLTMFRIPYPSGWAENTPRPIAFLQHGLLSSSDCWILNGPGMALAYMLVDAGYDVWLGNNRGNTYSRKHAEYSPLFQKFWQFEWHQIALHDIPAMIDYVLYKTNQDSLHYIGHSQGTTVLFVMTSMLPKYNAKIKSAQMLAPVAFMDNIRGPLVLVMAPIVGRPNAVVEVVGSAELLPNNPLVSAIATEACKEDTPAKHFCSSLIFAICGWNRESFNMSLFNDIIDTHPAGSSVNQVIHFLQEHVSGQFRQFDYGLIRNRLEYGQFSPPAYALDKVKVPVFLYYSDNDYLSHPSDVERLMAKLPNVQYSFRVPNPKWNHLDHLWAKDVKEIIFDRVLENVNKMESNVISS